MRKIQNILTFLTLILLVSCSSAGGDSEIVIYSTNDMHGAIAPYAKAIPYMQQAREEHPNALLLSAGDMFTGNPYVDFCAQRGLPIIQMMNRMDYDVATWGNHEFDYGQEALQTCMDSARCTYVCANVKVKEGNERLKSIPPYTFVQIGKTKVCILGLIETGHNKDGQLIPSCRPKNVDGLAFDNPIQTALSYRYLRNQCDVFVALTHLGVADDSLLAVQMPELDVIVGGHTHTRIDSGKYVNGVLITQTGSRMKYLGKTTLRMKRNKVVGKSFELIEIAALPEDSLLKTQIQRYSLDPVFAKKAGVSAYAFPTRRSLSFMMADLMKEFFNADFAFQNIGGIRCHSLPKGDLQMADLYRMVPFNDEMTVIQMNAADIRSFLFSSTKHLKDEVDLVPSGLKYTLTYTGTEITDVRLTDNDGHPLDEERVYSVVVNDYLSSHYRYTYRTPARSLHYLQIDMLLDYMKENTLKRPSIQQRWTLIR